MKAELLSYRPLSGEYEEHFFDAVGECQSVLFETKELKTWLGIFGNGGEANFSTAQLFSNSPNALVVAEGAGYVVNVNSSELIYKTRDNLLSGVIGIPVKDLFIACSFTSLFALSQEGIVWESKRISWDGIKLESASEDEVLGRVWIAPEGKWIPFQLVLDEWQIKGEASRYFHLFDR